MNIPAVTGKKKKIKAPAKQTFKIASLDKKKARAGWLFVLPFIIGFVLIYLPIIWDSITYSFSHINYLQGGGFKAEFVGLENYTAALFDNNSEFLDILKSGIGQLLLEIPIIVFFSLFVAIILNQKMPGRALFRAIFFIPVILTTGLIAKIDASQSIQDVMNTTNAVAGGVSSSSGVVNALDIEALFSNMAIGSEIVDIVTSFVNSIFDIVNRSGVQMLIFLSGLQGISPAIYESCQMEGASAWETFWKITLPMISPMIVVNLIYTIIDSFTSESNSVMKYISSIYAGSGDSQVVSSAMSWIYFLVVIAIVAVVALILRKFVFYQRRD